MIHMVLLFLTLLSVQHSHAQPLIEPTRDLAVCAHHAPYGFPRIRIPDYTTICRSGHALMYDNQARLAPWTIHTLRPEHVTACGNPRPNQFFPDPLVPTRARVTSASYRASGWDQGHLVSNANQLWHAQVQVESFFLTNVAPQHPSLNRQLWRSLESEVRSWVLAHGEHVIITGVIYDESSPRMGFHEIQIPTYFYKIITHVGSGRTWAFLAENVPTMHSNIMRIQSTVSEITQLSGVRFAQPDNPRLRRPLRPSHAQEMRQERRQSCTPR
jgi:endonuclease G, mitochondrial